MSSWVASGLEKRRIRRVYDRLAPAIDRWEAPLEGLLLGRYRRRLAGRAQGAVLEVGAGTGRNLPYYPPGVALTLCDISPAMLRQAAGAASPRRVSDRRRGQRAAAVVADAEALPFAPGSFDTVLCSFALCTIPDPVAALAEMKRVLRPGGRVLLLEHVLSPLRAVAWAQRRLSPGNVRRIGCHLDRDAAACVRAAGLAILRQEAHILGVLRLIVAAP